MSTATEANIYELHQRDSKCTAVIQFLDSVKNRKSWTDMDLLRVASHLDDEGWRALAAASGQHPLSDESQRLVRARLAGRVA